MKRVSKRQRKINKLRAIFIIISAVLFAVGCGLIWYVLNDSAKSGRSNKKAAQDYIIFETEDGGTGEEESQNELFFSVDFNSLTTAYPDAVAWIYQPHSTVNYPVMQGETNDTYLHTTYAGESTFAGSIFLDANNSSDFSDDINILYGHNMKNGTMFASLRYYFEKPNEWYNENPYFYLLTPEGEWRLDIFACVKTSSESSYYRYSFGSAAERVEYIDNAKRNSYVDTGVSVSIEDKIAVLSTCVYATGDARYVVLCKMTLLEED